MNLYENILRVKGLMGLVMEQGSVYGFWDKVIDVFMPGTPVKDAREFLREFDKIIERRVAYNKKNNLPIDTLSDEEKKFRERILKATPNWDYPYFNLSKMITDIKTGKNIRPEEIKQYTNPGFFSTWQKGSLKDTEESLNRREELKKMWLGIDDLDGDKSGFWVKSEFKPSTSKNPNETYYKPSLLPKLTTSQFDELYNIIMKTRKPDGTFPGGNSEDVVEMVLDEKLKYVDLNLIKKMTGDRESSFHSMFGSFKFGAGVDGSRKFISIYDEWDMSPPIAKKFGVDVQKYGKIPLIYYRIYRT